MSNRPSSAFGLTTVAMIALVLVSACASSRRGAEIKALNQGAETRKADYIYLEARHQATVDSPDAAFDLMSRASQLSPADAYIASELGYNLIALSGGATDFDSTLFDSGLSSLARYFAEAPDDYYASVFYGTLLKHTLPYHPDQADEALNVWLTLDSLYPHRPDVSLNLAETYTQRADSASLVRAIDIYNRLEQSQGPGLGLTSQKVRAYHALHDTTAIMSELHDLLARSPRSVDNSIYTADVFMAFEKPDSALRYYSRAVDLDSTSGYAHYKLAGYYRWIGDSVGYDREVFGALRQSSLDVPDKVEIMRGYVQSLYTDSLQYPRIEALFAQLQELHPHEASIHELYAAFYGATEQYARAADQLSYVVDLQPADDNSWRQLLSLYLNANNYSAASRQGRRAIHYHPDNLMLRLITASALMLADSVPDAVAMMQSTMEIADSSDVAMMSQLECTLADALYKDNQIDSAFVHYDRALRYDPANLLAMNNCAYYLACQNRDLDRAEQLSYRCITEEPDNATSLDTYAWVLYRKLNYAEARRYIDRAIEKDSEPSAELMEHAGDIYFMNQLPDEALDFWKEALKLDPENEALKQKIKKRSPF